MAIVPVPDGDAHLDPLLAVHVHVTPVYGTGKASVTEAPTAALGPLLTTATVHVNGVPAAATGTLGVFVNERSATTEDVSVAVPVSFAAFGIDRRARLARRRIDKGAQFRDAPRHRQYLGSGRRHGAQCPDARSRVVAAL